MDWRDILCYCLDELVSMDSVWNLWEPCDGRQLVKRDETKWDVMTICLNIRLICKIPCHFAAVGGITIKMWHPHSICCRRRMIDCHQYWSCTSTINKVVLNPGDMCLPLNNLSQIFVYTIFTMLIGRWLATVSHFCARINNKQRNIENVWVWKQFF